MSAMLERLPADQREAILKAADKNGNGQIDDDERGDAFRAMRELGGFGGGRGGQGGRAGD
jgi:Ca2+-binding EF-hand superfamily protein